MGHLVHVTPDCSNFRSTVFRPEYQIAGQHNGKRWATNAGNLPAESALKSLPDRPQSARYRVEVQRSRSVISSWPLLNSGSDAHLHAHLHTPISTTDTTTRISYAKRAGGPAMNRIGLVSTLSAAITLLRPAHPDPL